MARTVISVARDRMAHAGSGNAGTAEVSPTSILGLLLQNQELSDTELQNEIALFLFAGHETSASTLTFIMILLHRHPLCKARVRQEVDEVLGEDGKPTFEDLGKLRYTNAVMKEALRLFPIGWATVRETVEPTKLGEYMIPAKTQVMVDFLHMHRNPALFDRPTEFLPERWLTQTTTDVDNGVSETVDASSTGTVPYSYLPFSGGMRSCIGKPFAEIEIKLVTAMLIQRYDFHVEEPKSWEGVDVCDLYKDGTTLRPLPHTVWITPRR
ncbi:cytochrome P450 [Blastocladiella britannica]|nr:cytochrome P450 [Blastocladiella britannica]